MHLRSAKNVKYVLTLLFSFLTMAGAVAQESEFRNGNVLATLNLGFGSDNFYGGYFIARSPLVSGDFEVGVMDDIIYKGTIGVGGMLGICTFKRADVNGTYISRDFLTGARGTFHYPLISNLDTYTGMTLGFDFSNSSSHGKINNEYNSNQGLFFAWFLGGKYYFADQFAASAEVGVGITYLNLGISMKF